MYNMPFDNSVNTLNMRPVIPQTQIQCFAEESREEANKIPVQMGVVLMILNKSAKEIYIKQWNNDGLIDMQVFKDEKSIPPQKEEKDYTPMFNTLTSKLEELQKIITKPEITNVG